MKTKTSLITIFMIVLFLMSINVVATSLAKPPMQNVPESEQTQQQLPPTQIEAKAKEEFWDLEVDHFVINGKSFPFPNDWSQAEKISVTVGETVTFRSYYTLKTVPIGDITGIDAKYWGSGNFTYRIDGGMFFSGPYSVQEYKTLTRSLPKFTYEDVQQWKQSMQSNARKTWTSYLVYNWTPQMEHVGKDNIWFHFQLDGGFGAGAIKETDEHNNGNFAGTGTVAKITVIPPNFKKKEFKAREEEGVKKTTPIPIQRK